MFFGQKLARQYLDEEPLSTSASPGVPSAILSICLAELHFINERAEQLQFVVAIYLAFRLKCGDTRKSTIDYFIRKHVKSDCGRSQSSR